MLLQKTKDLKSPFFCNVPDCSRRFTQKKTQIHTDLEMRCYHQAHIDLGKF